MLVYQFKISEGASSQTEGVLKVLTTQDDMCIGTTGGSYKSLKRGSVKAQALKLSERLAQKGYHSLKNDNFKLNIFQ